MKVRTTKGTPGGQQRDVRIIRVTDELGREFTIQITEYHETTYVGIFTSEPNAALSTREDLAEITRMDGTRISW